MWIPGWSYAGFAEKDVGCMSVPRELKLVDGKITAFPIKELQHLLKDEDEAADTGSVRKRRGRQ